MLCGVSTKEAGDYLSKAYRAGLFVDIPFSTVIGMQTRIKDWKCRLSSVTQALPMER